MKSKRSTAWLFTRCIRSQLVTVDRLFTSGKGKRFSEACDESDGSLGVEVH
jgi:hypothetical protein